MNNIVRFYLIPGAIFQSAIVAGGYGTGREVMEFISSQGALAGLFACLVAALLFAVVLSATWELARLTKSYDYHSFTRVLLGPAWISYELLFIATLFLVQAVVAAAAGQVLSDLLPVEPWLGIVIMLIVIVALNYFGRNAVVTSMGITSVFVTLVMLMFCIAAILNAPENTSHFQSESFFTLDAATSGATFAMYNCLAIPVLLYAVAGQENRQQTLLSGLFAGLFAVIPAVLFHLAFINNISELSGAELPSYEMLKLINIKWLTLIYLVVLFATIVQSGVGVLQGLNERIDASLIKIKGNGLNKYQHALVAGCVVLLSGLLAQFGVIDLIAKGYRFIAYGLFAVYLLPLFVIGSYHFSRKKFNQNY